MQVELLMQPENEENRIGDFLKSQLSDGKWTHFYSASAFVKRSGVKHIEQELVSFSNTCEVRIICGVDMGGTSIEGVKMLHECIGNDNSLWFFHNEAGSTFHPKVYLFFNDNKASVAIGSGNMTEGGLFTNYEMGAVIEMDRSKKKDKDFFVKIINIFDSWSVNAGDKAILINDSSIKDLLSNGYLVSESKIQPHQRRMPSGKLAHKKLFGKEYASHPFYSSGAISASSSNQIKSESGQGRVFLMTLHQTDVGGEEGKTKSRRSPEIFIPLKARDHDKNFWGWKNLFKKDSSKPGKLDRRNVSVMFEGELIKVTMMTWPDKSDFRLRSTELRRAGEVGDILKLKKLDGRGGPRYIAKIISRKSKDYKQYRLRCNNSLPSSKKVWGYYHEQS